MNGTRRRGKASWWLIALLLVVGVPRAGHAAPPVTALTFAPDGNTVVVGSQAGLRLYALSDLRTPMASFDALPPAIHDVQFSASGDRLLVAGGIPGESGRVVLFDWPARERLWDREHAADVVYAVDWSADGSGIAAASHEGVGRVLTSAGGDVQQRLTGHSAGLVDVVWVDDQHVLTAGRDATLRLWEASTGALLRTFNNHVGSLAGVALRPADPTRATPSRLPLVSSIGVDRTIRFWQPTIGRLVRFLRLETARPVTAVWLPGGARLLVGTTAGQILLVDPLATTIEQTWKVAPPGEDVWITALAVGPDGREMVVGDSRGVVRTVTLSR
jgi:WD40 repeat protein